MKVKMFYINSNKKETSMKTINEYVEGLTDVSHIETVTPEMIAVYRDVEDKSQETETRHRFHRVCIQL